MVTLPVGAGVVRGFLDILQGTPVMAQEEAALQQVATTPRPSTPYPR